MTEAAGRGRQKPRGRHTGAQRLVLVINCLVVVACLAGAAGLLIGKTAAEQSMRVSLAPRSEPTTTEGVHVSAASMPTQTAEVVTTEPTTTSPEPPVSQAKNFLVVGVDNDACIDPNSPYAAGIGPRSARLTDTIMVIRVDFATKRVAILSFPRDLWVRVNGSMRKINSAYRNSDPTALVQTIDNEFKIHVDHFIRVDFCAFMELVDGVGGVTVPLPYAVRDLDNTGLDVQAAGCHRFAGDEALAYVRSRHLQYRNDAGQWRSDGSNDFGRIARQQDFLRRTLGAAKQHLLSASVIRSLYSTYKHYLEIDDQLTISNIIELADVLRQVDATHIRSYQVDVTGRWVSGQSVLIANDTVNMTAILDVFRGSSPLAAEAQVADATPTISPTTDAASLSTNAVVVSEPEPNAPANAIVPDPAAEC